MMYQFAKNINCKDKNSPIFDAMTLSHIKVWADFAENQM